MQLWILLALSLVALIVGMLLAAVRLELELRAVLEPSGAWACAFGASLGLLTVAGVVAAGRPTQLELHVFGRRFDLARRQERRRRPARRPKPSKPAKPLAERVRDLDVRRVADVIAGTAQRVRVGALDVDVTYCFRDVTLTGSLAGALSTLGCVLPASVRLSHTPEWIGGDRVHVRAEGQLVLWPGRVLGDVVWGMLRAQARRLRRPQAPAPLEGTAP